MSDPFDLQRFVAAQDRHETYAAAVGELLGGYKRSHWMWFVFPQIAGLGRSGMAQRYAISGLAEAQAYLDHPILGGRLRECAGILTALDATDPVSIFGSIDAHKLQSSMTLFAHADPSERVFRDVLDQYFAGATDDGTTSRL